MCRQLDSRAGLPVGEAILQWLKHYTEAGAMPASFLMGLALLLAGCGSDIPSSTVTTGLTLDCQAFQTNVYPILDNPIFDVNGVGRTCSASGCHSPTSAGGAFKIFPGAAPNTVEMQANYFAALG